MHLKISIDAIVKLKQKKIFGGTRRKQERSNRTSHFDSQKLLCQLSKVQKEKVNIESQVKNEPLQTSLQIQVLQDQVSQMKVERNQLEEATKKVDKEKRQIAHQLGAAIDTQSRLKEGLENTEE